MKMRVLSQKNVQELIELDRVLETVEQVYTAKAQEKTVVWPTVFHEWVPSEHDMDIKSGYLKGMELHGMKALTFHNTNEEKGLPTLMGVIVVFDTETGAPLVMADAAFITGVRTGCAGAIGAKYLARKNSDTLFVLGTGNQAIFQIGAFLKVFPNMRKVYVCNPRRPERAKEFAASLPRRLAEELRVEAPNVTFTPIGAGDEMAQAVAASDMIVTVTPAREPVIQKSWVKPGTHISCIGADMPGKEELDPELFRGACIFTDDLDHAITSGEMEIPLKSGVIGLQDVAGEIGNLILGRCSGRTDDDQITIYDACGMALLDIAAAKALLDLADAADKGQSVDI